MRDAAIEIAKKGRPVLVFCKDIATTQKIADVISKSYNGVQNETSDAIINLAGTPGTITVTTLIGARGADIAITEEAAQNKGLHCISSILMKSERTETQLFNRAGRRGEPGSFQYIVDCYEQELDFDFDSSNGKRAINPTYCGMQKLGKLLMLSRSCVLML